MSSAYRKLIWRRAVTETTKALSLSWGLARRTVLVGGVGVLLAWIVSSETGVNMAISVFVGVILANVVVVVGILAINMFRAPALIHADQEGQIAALSLLKRRREVATILAQQSEKLVNEFWANRPPSNSEVDTWVQGVDAWHTETLAIMEREGCTPAEIISVRTLGNLTEFAHPVVSRQVVEIRSSHS